MKSIKQAFTLTELLVAVVLIGVLAGIAVYAYNSIKNETKTASNLAAAKEVLEKADLFKLKEGFYPHLYQLKNATTNGNAADTSGHDVPDAKIDKKIVDRIQHDSFLQSNKDAISYKLCTDGKATHDSHSWDFEGGADLAVMTGASIRYWSYTRNRVELLQIGHCYCESCYVK